VEKFVVAEGFWFFKRLEFVLLGIRLTSNDPRMNPFLILLIGTAIVIGGIVAFRIGAFFSLILAAIAVSILAPGGDKITRVAEAFGSTAAGITIVIACAAVIGKAMMDSGGADRVVRTFLKVLGEKRAPIAMMSSGFVLSIPVFFDTVFYLLVPLARSLYRSTQKNFLLYVLAIGVGGAITHTLVPPTPGPLLMASNLNFDVGIMIIMGIVVAFPTAVVTLWFAHWLQRRMDIPMRPVAGVGEEEEVVAEDDAPLPGLFVSLLPIILPVLIIGGNTVISTMAKNAGADSWQAGVVQSLSILGDTTKSLPTLALMLSAAIALLTYWNTRKPSLVQMGKSIETALMSAGIIILITSAGGACGGMLKLTGLKEAIEGMFAGSSVSAATVMLLMGWAIAALLKTSQGSSTVAMITASGMLASLADPTVIHPVYLALAIGCGSLFASWMNDSGFWIFSKMSGLTEVEALKTWTPALIVLSLVGLLITMLLSKVLPMVAGAV
jgi:GntP family gluconate:H+ symporter